MTLILLWGIIAIILCGMAYLVHNKKMYDLISGYNTSSEEEKEEYRKNGYLLYTGRFLWGMAFVWLIGFVFVALDAPYAMEVHLVTFLLYTMGGTILSSKYSLKRKRKRNYIFSISLTMLVLAFVGGLFFFGMRPTEVTISNQSISFGGMYSYELKFKEIESIEIIESLPDNINKTNGFGTSTRALGHFSSDELGKGRMYVFVEHAPYILLNTKEGFLILNSKDDKETIQWYNLLDEQIQR